MTAKQKNEALYAVNLALLATHEIDSAYWHEWTMMGIPGGVQLFLTLNLALLLVFSMGLVRVVRGDGSGVWLSLGLAASGILAFSRVLSVKSIGGGSVVIHVRPAGEGGCRAGSEEVDP
jgi:hypothetical protein